MSGLILPPLAMPLFASLKKKSGHLTRNSTGVRHLAKCNEGRCCDSAPATLTATISGASGCTAPMNGTFVLSPTVACKFSYTETLRADSPSCSAGDACHVTTTPSDIFWFAFKLFVTAELSAVTNALEVRVELSWSAYEVRSGSCVGVLFLPSGQTVVFGRSTCRTGDMAVTGSTGQPWASNPYACTVSW